mgnify:CR=1 FL=1
MPLNFNPYQSTYVDPGSVKISEVLRSRFADNFASDDAFAQSVSEMISLAPDEGAKALLEDKYRGIMDERASKGDYENMGMQIVRDSRKFKTEYDPIAEQAARRAQINEKLEGRVGAKENGITNQMYEDAMGHMDNQYAATGGVSEGGQFAGMNVPEYVDILAEVLEDIKGIKPDIAGGVEVEYAGLGGEEAASTGLMGSAGFNPDLVFSYKTKQGNREYVDPAEIQAIFQARIDDPKVREYLQYDSRMKVSKMSEEQVNMTLTDSARKLRAMADQIQDPETKKAYNKLAAERENLIGTEDARAGAETAVYMNTLDPIRQAAIAKGAYTQEGDSGRYLEVDSAWTALNTKKRDNEVPFAGVSGALQTQNSASGTDLGSKTRYLVDQKAALEAMKTGEMGKLITKDLGITFDELNDMSVEEYASANSIDMEAGDSDGQLGLFNRHKTQLLETQARIVATETAIREVRNEIGLPAEVVFQNIMDIGTSGGKVSQYPGQKHLDPSSRRDPMADLGFGTIGSVINKLKAAVPNMDDEAIYKLLMSRAAHGDPGAYQSREDFDGQQVSGDLWKNFFYENREQADAFTDLLTLNKGGVGEQSIFNSNAFIKGLREARDYINVEVMENIDTALAERSTQEFTPTVYNVIPGMGKDQKNAIKDLMVGMTAQQSGSAYVHPTTGELVAIDELAEAYTTQYATGSNQWLKSQFKGADGFDAGSMEIVDLNFNIANIGRHGGTVDVVYKDKNGNKLPAQIPMTQMRNADIDAFVNSDSYRVVRQAAAQFSEGIKMPVVHLKNNETGVISEIEIDLNRQTWSYEGKSGTLTAALAQGGIFSDLGSYNSVVVPRAY